MNFDGVAYRVPDRLERRPAVVQVSIEDPGAELLIGSIGQGADDCHRIKSIRGKRERSVVILEHYNALQCCLLCDLQRIVARDRGKVVRIGIRVFEQSQPNFQPQDIGGSRVNRLEVDASFLE